LLSAVVAQFLGTSLQNLQPNPQNASSFYLAHIYQVTPGSNVSSIPFDDPATFKPPTSAILVSSLWSLSLVVSLTCALLASLLQQWARRYLRITQKWKDPQKRALTRELMAQALKKVHVSWLIILEPLPFLLHTAVFLFLTGFVVYLFTFNNLVAKLAGACAGISLLSYLYVSVTPFFAPDSISASPITSLLWAIPIGIISLIVRLRHLVTLCQHRLEDADRFKELLSVYYQRILNGFAWDVGSLADAHPGLASSVLSWTCDCLDGVNEMEKFLSHIPGFYTSGSARRQFDKQRFEYFNYDQLPVKIGFFMEHVLSSNLSDDEKHEHIAMCSQAMNANTSLLRSTFRLTLQTPNSNIFDYPDFVKLALEQLRRDDADSSMKDYARCVMAIAINRAQLRDGAWTEIARNYLDLDGEDEQYSQNIYDLRLCSLIHLTQQLKDSQLATSDQFADGKVWHNALAEAHYIDVTTIAPDLRNRFLILWDQLENLAQDAPTDQERQNVSYVIDLLDFFITDLRGH
jgi:hypothetical protein